ALVRPGGHGTQSSLARGRGVSRAAVGRPKHLQAVHRCVYEEDVLIVGGERHEALVALDATPTKELNGRGQGLDFVGVALQPEMVSIAGVRRECDHRLVVTPRERPDKA